MNPLGCNITEFDDEKRGRPEFIVMGLLPQTPFALLNAILRILIFIIKYYCPFVSGFEQ